MQPFPVSNGFIKIKNVNFRSRWHRIDIREKPKKEIGEMARKSTATTQEARETTKSKHGFTFLKCPSNLTLIDEIIQWSPNNSHKNIFETFVQLKQNV